MSLGEWGECLGKGGREMRGMPAGCLAGLRTAGSDEAAVQRRE